MRKMFCVAVVMILLCACLAGCGKKKAQPDEGTPMEQDQSAAKGAVVGGWTIDTDSEVASLPDEIQEAFELASQTLPGNELVPVAPIGEQVVAGMNYAVLCRSTPVTENPETGLSVLIIYKDLDGKATVSNIADFIISNYTDKEDDTEVTGELAGGWSFPENVKTISLPQKVQSAFEKAMSSYSGNNLEPIAYLGSQIVSGTNYAVLCRSTSEGTEPLHLAKMVFIYEDLEGNASVMNCCTLDAASFNGN